MVLVGGGLQNGLIALAALRASPDLRIAMIERADSISGNHTWCFQRRDVPASIAPVVDAITTYRWDGYTVHFPCGQRSIDEPYAGTTSTALAAAVRAAFADSPRRQLMCGVAATDVGANRVALQTGDTMTADLVVDARGPDQFPAGGRSARGYQKFVGLELALARPHRLNRPILMDATVPQVGGFRFFYVLPLAVDRVLVEDTTFSRDPSLDLVRLERNCLRFAEDNGFLVESVIRTETGVLPMPWASVPTPPRSPLRAGYGGGWFHPATGYSFPIAARLAAFIAGRTPSKVIGPALVNVWRAHDRQVRFCHRLNKLLFQWFVQGEEWHALERFYQLPAALIARFYALDTTWMDRARILVGRPPGGFSLRARLAARDSRPARQAP